MLGQREKKTACCHSHRTRGDGCPGHEPGGVGMWAVLLLPPVPGCIPHPGDAGAASRIQGMARHHADPMWPCASFMSCQAWAERGCPGCRRANALRGPLFFPAAGGRALTFSPSPSPCPGLSPFSVVFQSWVLGQTQASGKISPVKPKLPEFSSSFWFFLFPVERELAEASCVFFQAFSPPLPMNC